MSAITPLISIVLFDNYFWLIIILPYGVHAATNRKHIVMAALAIFTSAVSELFPWLDRNDSTFIFFALNQFFMIK